MATALTTTETCRLENQMRFIQFNVTALSGSATSSCYSFSAPMAGSIRQVRAISAAGTDIDFYVGVKDSFTATSIDCVYSWSAMTTVMSDAAVNLVYLNRDTVQTNNLYLIVKNNGADSTGAMTFEFVIESI